MGTEIPNVSCEHKFDNLEPVKKDKNSRDRGDDRWTRSILNRFKYEYQIKPKLKIWIFR